MIQIYIPGHFGKAAVNRELQREAAKERYGGTTFTVVGRTHDMSVKNRMNQPVSKYYTSGYIGYLLG